MSNGTEVADNGDRYRGHRLFIPALAPFYDRFKPLTYGLLRVASGLRS